MTLRELIEETKQLFLRAGDGLSSVILDTEISTIFYALAWIAGVILALWVSLIILGVLGSLADRFLERYYPPLFDFFKYYDPSDDIIMLAIWLTMQGLIVYGISTTGFTLEHLVYMLPVLAIDAIIIRAMHRRYKRLKSERLNLVSLD
ncbi:MAG: hypothetical protein AB2776_19625 [Candidatus Thiodiazotropha endolucinida]